MKSFKFIIFILAFCIYTNATAQSDTTRISGGIRFEQEVLTTKTGNTVEKVYAIHNNETYESNKTSMKRYTLIRRYNGEPCVVMITNKRSKSKKIIVL